MSRFENILETFFPIILIALCGLSIFLAMSSCAYRDQNYRQEIVQVGDVKWLCLQHDGKTISCETVENPE